LQTPSSDDGTGSHRRLAAIMFTDMVGYSALAQADEAASLAVLDRHNRLLRPIFSRFRGREVKTVGDAFLVEFESALDAVRCAIELQRSLHDYNAATPVEWKIRIRIGVHVGDVVQTDGDVLGDAVNLASRIESLADPEGICLTQQTYDQVQNKISMPFVKMPAVALKNIRLPMSVYKIVQPWDTPSAEATQERPEGGRHLAVLPLANISPDPGDGYFADGLTEELISVLSQVRDLNVIARTSVNSYKATPKSVAQVGAELGVDTILEGSVRKAGKRIRITLQLVDVPTQRHIWASSYDREIDDVFAVQTDVAERTAEALRLQLSKGEPSGLPRPPTTNLAAYDQYLRGMVAANDLTAKRLPEAIRYFERATTLDPTFSEAFAAWGNLYVTAAGDLVPVREVMPRARELVARALALDPESSDAHAALGNITLQFDHNWKRAEEEFRKAISLNPSNIAAHNFLALLLLALERFEEAKEVLRHAIRLDPSGPQRRRLMWTEIESGNYDAAFEYGEQDRDRDPMSVASHVYLGFGYLMAGRRADALREADTPLEGAGDVVRFDHALLNSMVGRPEAARALIAEAERGEASFYISASDLGMLYASLGEKEKALELLEKDFRDGDMMLWIYYRSVFFDSIRDEPRFVALLRQYGLPTHGVHRPRPAEG
jgi:adenylate cyclase